MYKFPEFFHAFPYSFPFISLAFILFAHKICYLPFYSDRMFYSSLLSQMELRWLMCPFDKYSFHRRRIICAVVLLLYYLLQTREPLMLMPMCTSAPGYFHCISANRDNSVKHSDKHLLQLLINTEPLTILMPLYQFDAGEAKFLFN